jgi:manganese transport protein
MGDSTNRVATTVLAVVAAVALVALNLTLLWLLVTGG